MLAAFLGHSSGAQRMSTNSSLRLVVTNLNCRPQPRNIHSISIDGNDNITLAVKLFKRRSRSRSGVKSVRVQQSLSRRAEQSNTIGQGNSHTHGAQTSLWSTLSSRHAILQRPRLLHHAGCQGTAASVVAAAPVIANGSASSTPCASNPLHRSCSSTCT
jgi:hypothetical protein